MRCIQDPVLDIITVSRHARHLVEIEFRFMWPPRLRHRAGVGGHVRGPAPDLARAAAALFGDHDARRAHAGVEGRVLRVDEDDDDSRVYALRELLDETLTM